MFNRETSKGNSSGWMVSCYFPWKYKHFSIWKAQTGFSLYSLLCLYTFIRKEIFTLEICNFMVNRFTLCCSIDTHTHRLINIYLVPSPFINEKFVKAITGFCFSVRFISTHPTYTPPKFSQGLRQWFSRAGWEEKKWCCEPSVLDLQKQPHGLRVLGLHQGFLLTLSNSGHSL